MPPARDLSEAISALDPGPLDPSHGDWYVENEAETPSGRRQHPLAMLRAGLLRARDSERLFLSGHTGSGKTTELRRLLRDPQINRRYFLVNIPLSREEVPELTSSHLLFIIAAELYENAKDLLGKEGRRWHKMIQRLDERFFGQKGVAATEGAVEVKFNLVFLELRQQLKLQSSRREEFRKFAETDGTLLVNLIDELVDDITTAVQHAGSAERVLVVVDETDKLRSSTQIDEIFGTNFGAIRAPKVPMLMTLPASVTFGGPTTELGQSITHLRPVQILLRAGLEDPLGSIDRKSLPYMQAVIDRRVAPGLFAPEVIESAAVYSGGVLRNFFELLRSAAIRALDLYELATVDLTTFHDQLEEAKNALARGTYPAERATLAKIRRTNELPDRDALRLLNTFVLEYNHTGIWWEANPLLWHTLK